MLYQVQLFLRAKAANLLKREGTAWYRSKEPFPLNDPFVGDGYLSNKKWPLIEVRTTPGSNTGSSNTVQ